MFGEDEGDVGVLSAAGVAPADEVVYRALLERRETTPAELAAALGEGRDQVNRALDRLRAQGLVSRLSGRRRRFAATDPETALDVLVRARATELDDVRRAVVGFAEVFRTAKDASGAAEVVEIVTGRRALGEWFVRLQHGVKHEMMVLDRPPYALAAANPVEPVSLAQGVHWRAIYTPESLEMTGAAAEIRQLKEMGEEARVLPDFPLKLAIADRRIGLLPLSLDLDTSQVAVVRPSTLLDALIGLFESYWAAATPLDSDHTAPAGDAPSDDDATLITLLVTGLKDDAIARQLGLSTRTMRRRMRRLYEQLEVSNRFQAGVQAARRGWI